MLAVTIPLHILYCILEYTAEYHEWTFDGRSVWCSEQMSGAAFHPPQHMQYVLIQSCYAVHVNIIRRRYDSNITRGPLVSTSSICMIMVHVLRTTASLWEALLSFLKQQWDRRCSRPRHRHHFTGYSISRRSMGDGAIMELMRCTRTGDTNQSGAPLSLCGHH